MNLPQPTDAELEILQVLWQDEPCTVRYVNDLLNEKRAKGAKEIGYTTTLKFMQLMLEKGLVRREVNDRVHTYYSGVGEHDTQERLLEGFVNAAFRGSASSLVMRALGSSETTKEELDEIKALISQLEKL